MPIPPNIRVSYLITTRNRCSYLARMLDNVREFITPDDELIVFDGGSTDGTAGVIASNRDIVAGYTSESDKGEAHGFNRGILAARGRYIKFLSDDDYVHPAAIRHMINVFDNNPTVDAIIAGGEAYVFDESTGKEKLLAYSFLPRGVTMADNFHAEFRYVFCGLGLMLRRSAVEIAGLLDTSYISVDLEYIARLTFSGVNFQYVNINAFKHYRHAHSSSLTFENARREMRRLKKRYPVPSGTRWSTPENVCEALELPLTPENLVIGDIARQLITRRFKLLAWLCTRTYGAGRSLLMRCKLIANWLRGIGRTKNLIEESMRQGSGTLPPSYDGTFYGGSLA